MGRHHVLKMRSVTIRFPDELATQARAEGAAEGKSINQFVVESVAEAIERRRAQRALRNMRRRRERMRAAGLRPLSPRGQLRRGLRSA
jgi:hypothetical protein